ncbi:MAG: KUP/HAK/KT family potassium transporter [Deltaproteobacteria bacterium]|nr:KUP/HAK/KT family potassium transporter [Deltaproteobacteria bacterium]
MNKIIKSLGLVFGDIGTSPIYTLTIIFLVAKPTPENVRGVLSLIVWTIITHVTVEYAWLATKLSKKGEGGTIVLREILVPYLKTGRQAGFITLLSFVAISLFVGDGVITPAISLLSAVEGSLLIPGFEHTSQTVLIVIAGVIALALFMFQRHGTGKVAGAFGPIMVVWFIALAASGAASIYEAPSVIWSLNPYYGLKFVFENGFVGFLVLNEVILCATGGEALYSDMGHLGREPIIRAWDFVFVALLLNYLGQGAFLLNHPGAKNLLFEMIYNQVSILYIPFLLLSIMATIIASQAMISGMFSIVYQGITTHVMPLFKVEYTSSEMRGQIYIGFVNWFLLVFVILIMYEFRESSKLAVAYGLAVNGTMTITAVMMALIYYNKREFVKSAIAAGLIVTDIIFLAANMFKLEHGGYWSIVIAMLPFSLILIYTQGQKRLHRAMRPLNREAFLIGYNQIYKGLHKISGTALFFAKSDLEIPPYIVHTIFKNNIVYEDNVFIAITRTDEPYGLNYYFKEDMAPGLRVFEIKSGYMEVVDVEAILKASGINEKTIFYGLEEIATDNIIWRVFSIIKRVTPSFLQFYKLPPNKLHGVITRVEM